MFRKSTLVITVFGSLLLIGSAIPSQAQTSAYNNCELRVRKAEQNLDKAIKRYGKDSPEAGKRKRELMQQRQKCQVQESHGRKF